MSSDVLDIRINSLERHCRIDSSFSSPFRTDSVAGAKRGVSDLRLEGDCDEFMEDVKIEVEPEGLVPKPPGLDVPADEDPHKIELPVPNDEDEKGVLDPNADVPLLEDDPNRLLEPEVEPNILLLLALVPKEDLVVEPKDEPKLEPPPKNDPPFAEEVGVAEGVGGVCLLESMLLPKRDVVLVEFCLLLASLAFANAAANGLEFFAD